MSRFLKMWQLAGMILVVVTALSEARADDPYLPCVGPPPLRFETVMARNAAPAAKLILPNPNPATTPATNTAASVAAAKPINAATTNASAVAVAPLAAENPGKPVEPELLPLSAMDLLAVTPQMLADYLKPAGGTNQTEATVLAPEKIGFTPPTPKADNQSRATYKTQ